MRLLFTLCLSLLSIPFFAQDGALFQWTDHLPYKTGINTAEAGDRVYCATKYALVAYDKNYSGIVRYNKVNGLSDSELTDIAYSSDVKTLVVAYSNANIDLITPDGIINISDIKRKNILGNKTIYRVLIRGDKAWLACGFGIVVLDLTKREVKDTYIIGETGSNLEVYDLAFSNTDVYASTADGIRKASLTDPLIALYSSWSKLQNTPVTVWGSAVWWNNLLCIQYPGPNYNDDTLFFYNPSESKWTKLVIDNFYEIKRIQTTKDGRLVVSYDGAVDFYKTDLTTDYRIYNPGGLGCAPSGVAVSSDGTVWMADRQNGFVKVTNSGFTGEIIAPSGPYSSNVYGLTHDGENLYIAHGGKNSAWGGLYITDGVSAYNGSTWKYFRRKYIPAFDTMVDALDVAADASTKKAWIAMYGYGVVELTDGQLTNIYNLSNTPMKPFWNSSQRLYIVGLALDANKNLWVANSGSTDLIAQRKPDGTWVSHYLGGSLSGKDNDVLGIMCDSYGQKWLTMRKDQTLVCYNEASTTGTKVRVLTGATGNGALPNNKVQSIAEDLDGELWIGTNSGIAIIYNPGSVLAGNVNIDAQRPVITLDGYNQYLLDNEAVTVITVDGANNKWVGTERSGAYLLSPDGTKEIYHFTSENSPLLDNAINDIVIDPKGNVYFGTPKGVVSFKGSATEGNETNDNLLVYPNPVKPDYNGPIAIKGLTSNAWVKITDISGALVYETRADGGQAIWYGKNMHNEKVETGVYLVFVTDEDGTETATTKILFIK